MFVVQERHADELLLNVCELLGEARRLQAVRPGMYQPGIKSITNRYLYAYIYRYNV